MATTTGQMDVEIPMAVHDQAAPDQIPGLIAQFIDRELAKQELQLVDLDGSDFSGAADGIGDDANVVYQAVSYIAKPRA